MQRAQHDLCGKPNKRLVIDVGICRTPRLSFTAIQRFSAIRRVCRDCGSLSLNLIDYLERNHSLDEFLDWAATNCQSFVSQRSAPRATDSRTADFS